MKRTGYLRSLVQWVLILALTSIYFSCDSVKETSDPEVTSPASSDAISKRLLVNLHGLNAPVVVEPFSKAFVVRHQKIVVLTEKELPNSDRKSIPVSFNDKTFDARVVRVSEYPNPIGEYDGVTYTVLLEFEEKVIGKDIFSKISLRGARAQSNNNIIVADDDSGDPHDPPPRPPVTANPGEIIKIFDSDFRIVRVEDVNQYARQDNVVVAMVDTGIKFNFIDHPGQPPFQYQDYDGQWRTFRLSRGYAPHNSGGNNIGYCGITEYLRASADSDSQHDQLYRNEPKLSVLRNYKRQDIINSAFDDYRALTPKNLIIGRHGTFITSIINQQGAGAAVLPVKAFNYGGHGTLYDVLCSLNYVLAQKKNGVPIQILNASWVGSLQGESLALLRSKFAQLEQAGILVVAAAGNEHQNLSQNKLYPACFSNELRNVITVTSLLKKSTATNQLNDKSIGYEASLNYSNEFVTVGVVGGSGVDNSMQSPFLNKLDKRIDGTSYAAAHVSGLAAKYLIDHSVTLNSMNIGETKERILNALTKTDQSLASEVAGGRYLQVK